MDSLIIVACRSKIRDDALYLEDLSEEVLIIYPLTVVQRETRVQCELLEIRIRIDFAVLVAAQELPDRNCAFMVNDWHIALHGRPIERGGGSLLK